MFNKKIHKGNVMKKLSVSNLLMVVLFTNVMFLQGMINRNRSALQQVYKLRGKPTPQVNIPTSGDNIPTVNIPVSSQPIGPKISQQQQPQQTWGSWFRSFFSSANKSKEFNFPSKTFTLPLTGQKRFYSSSASTQQSDSGSFSEQKKLTPEELSNEVSDIIKGHRVPQLRMYIFNKDDLDIAIAKFDELFKQHEEYKTYLMTEMNYEISSGTVLDKVLCMIFDKVIVLDYIQLAQYLLTKGIKINPANEKIYVYIYCNSLMKSYKAAYGPKPIVRRITGHELDRLKKIFNALDPLFDQIITDPALKSQLRQAQQERVNIEKNENNFREELKNKADKEEYLREKAWYETRQELGDGDEFFVYENKRNDLYARIYERIKKEPFNESEYQEWLKKDKDRSAFRDFAFKQQSQEKQQQWYQEQEQKWYQQQQQFRKQQQQQQYQQQGQPTETRTLKEQLEQAQMQLIIAHNNIIQALGIVNTNASREEIKSAYNKFVKLAHSDLTKNTTSSLAIKLKEKVNPAWDEYNRALALIKHLENQQKGNQE
jgi:hypothetical protein